MPPAPSDPTPRGKGGGEAPRETPPGPILEGKEQRTATAPTLVIGIGNSSRGDDALGPLLLAHLETLALPGVELLEDYQLQVEFLLDLDGRERVVFVDAGVAGDAPYRFTPASSAPDASYTSHALAPEAVLAAYQRHFGRSPPPAWTLAIRAHSFELGEGLSPEAAANLTAAQSFLADWLTNPSPLGENP